MELSNNVARISGLGEPTMYVVPANYNTAPVERIESIQARTYQANYPSPETVSKAEVIQSSAESMASYKPGDLVHLYA